jgi:hypothetical protein
MVRVLDDLRLGEEMKEEPLVERKRRAKDEKIGRADPVEIWNADLIEVRPELPVKDVAAMENCLGAPHVGTEAASQYPMSSGFDVLEAQVSGFGRVLRLDLLRGWPDKIA